MVAATRANPYAIESPALISFSGGRTSGYMLWHILDAHGGTLPEGVHVTFANTGKERAETLAFVHEIETRWPVRVRWLEYRYVAPLLAEDVAGHHTYTEVTYPTASRKGEPFAQLVAVRKFLPNPVSRFCTTELKVRVMKKFMQDQGCEEWDSAIGLRADEPSRLHRAKLSCARERWNNVMPMATAGATLADVMAFWHRQPFDLQLEQYEGNCDLCFLKGGAKIERIIRASPESADWWATMEQKVGGTFRSDRPSYANLLKQIEEQPTLPLCGDHEYDVCNCTD